MNDENRLRSLRKAKGFTQIKMQHLTGIDQSDYSKIESGKRYINVIVGGGGLSATASTADVKRIYRTYAD